MPTRLPFRWVLELQCLAQEGLFGLLGRSKATGKLPGHRQCDARQQGS